MAEVITYKQGGSSAGEASRTTYTPDPEQVNGDTIRDQARNALATDRGYLAIATPSNAQVAAQVRALTQQNIGIIRLLLGQLDGVN